MVLGEFLKETKKSPSSVKFAEMANILVIHCQTTGEHMAALQIPPPQKPLPATGEHMAALQSPPPQKPPLPTLDRVLVGVGGSVTAGPGAVGPCGRDSGSVSMEAFSLGLALDGGISGGLAGRLGISTVN